jgi:hypothetical protein
MGLTFTYLQSAAITKVPVRDWQCTVKQGGTEK